MNSDLGSLHHPIYTNEILANALNNGGEFPALHLDGDMTLTANEIRDTVSRYAQAFESLAIGKFSRVAMLSPNRPECLHVTNALQILAAIYIPLHPLSSFDDHLFALKDADAEILIFDPERFSERAIALIEGNSHIRLLSLGSSDLCDDLFTIAESFTPSRLVAAIVKGDDVCRLGYSGGTTGKAKAIPSTYLSSTVCGQIMQAEWEWPNTPRALTCSPLTHAGAAMFMPALLRRGSLLVLNGFEPVKVMQAIETHKINCMLMVPTMIYALLDCPRLGEFDLSSLETIFYGASAISPPRLNEAIKRIGPVFAQFYGQAEAPMCITYLAKADHTPDDLTRLASCGKPSPYVRVQLLDAECRPVADGQPGEICVQGPLVMNGYRDESLNEDVFRGGWHHTGDVAIRHPDGFLQIVDRVKDMVVSGGFNIFPREIEDIIAEHPAVNEVAVIGLPHQRWGEVVTAIVVLKPHHSIKPDELSSAVTKRKGSFQAPKLIEFVDAIPLTPLGKPDKKLLRHRFAYLTA